MPLRVLKLNVSFIGIFLALAQLLQILKPLSTILSRQLSGQYPRSEPESLCSPKGCRFRILVVGRVGYFLLLRLVPPMLTILSLALESHH